MNNQNTRVVDVAALEFALNLFHDEELSMGYPRDAGEAARIQRRFASILNKHFPDNDFESED